MFIFTLKEWRGKGGNETCSLRWANEGINLLRLHQNQVPLPIHRIKVLDNCVGQVCILLLALLCFYCNVVLSLEQECSNPTI